MPGIRTFLLFAVVALSAGCGSQQPRTYRVDGQVVFRDDEPVSGGIVEFQSVERRLNARGRIDENGGFRLTTYQEGDGAVAGRHRAVVIQTNVTESFAEHHGLHADPVAVDTQYNSYETSGLEFEIQPNDENHLRIVVDRNEPER